MIKAILIDDEGHCLETLSILLREYCPEVQVLEQCTSAREGLAAISKLTPDLVFLDIEMPMMNGFELLESFVAPSFSVIFTTSYNQYAIRAIRFSALDYLMKPIDPKELVTAVQRIRNQQRPPSPEQFRILASHTKSREPGFHKIAVPTLEGYELIAATEILYCEASDNYTHLHLKTANRITACRTLKEIEDQLGAFGYFVRVHHSFVVNLNEVTKYVRGDGGYVVLSDETTVNVSRSRKEELLRRF